MQESNKLAIQLLTQLLPIDIEALQRPAQFRASTRAMFPSVSQLPSFIRSQSFRRTFLTALEDPAPWKPNWDSLDRAAVKWLRANTSLIEAD
eukprot:6360987-Amphidinium_carterae.1